MNGRFKQSVVVFVQKGDNKMLTITHLKNNHGFRLFAKNEKKMIVDLLKRGGGGRALSCKAPSQLLSPREITIDKHFLNL